MNKDDENQSVQYMKENADDHDNDQMLDATNITRRNVLKSVGAGAAVSGFGLPSITVAAHEVSPTDTHLAQTPPMGWNSWNAFGKNVNETLIENVADAMVSSGMKDVGYEYLVIDGGWRAPTRDASGDMQPNPEKFPSGMEALGDYIHSKGLKFGLHQAVGETDCSGRFPGTGSASDDTYSEKAQRDANTFAEWGIDYLKFDWCSAPGSRRQKFQQMHQALEATGRDIVYSVNPQGSSSDIRRMGAPLWGSKVGANMWRTTQDIKPLWNDTGGNWYNGVVDIIDKNESWAPYVGPGHWNNPDMLEIGVDVSGYPGLTEEEGRSQFSMWAMMAAPLMAGTDLRNMSEATHEILTNDEVLAVDQDSAGIQGRRIRATGNKEVWAKPLTDLNRAVALFNRGETEEYITTSTDEVGQPPSKPGYVVRDLWNESETFTTGKFGAGVPPHGVAMFTIQRGAPADAPPELTLTFGDELDRPPIVGASQTSVVTTTLTNQGRTAVQNVDMSLNAPDGWDISAKTSNELTVIPPSESVTVEWAITPSQGTSTGKYTLQFMTTYQSRSQQHDTEAFGTVTVAPPAPTSNTYLEDLEWINATVGHANIDYLGLGESWGPRDNPITIGGTVYDHGISTHATSIITYYLGGNLSKFVTDVGIDDQIDNLSDEGHCVFRIFGDGELLRETDKLTSSMDIPVSLNVDVSGVEVLKIVAYRDQTNNNPAHADWAIAELLE